MLSHTVRALALVDRSGTMNKTMILASLLTLCLLAVACESSDSATNGADPTAEPTNAVTDDALSDRALAPAKRYLDLHLVVAARRVGRNRFVELGAPERRVEQRLGAVPDLVGAVKGLRDHDAFGVGHVGAGIGDAVEDQVAGLHLIVEDPVGSDHFRIDVREQRIGDRLLLGELLEDFLVVVGDRVERDPGRFELGVGVSQLTELRPAGRSPDRRAVEDDDRRTASAICMERDGLAVGVGQGEVGQLLADLGPGRMALRQPRATRAPLLIEPATRPL